MKTTDTSLNPFSNGGDERNMIVVMSDIHLGADSAYTECKKNLGALEHLLNQIRVADNVKELVIAGDLLDEWFVPAPVNTYAGKDQADFVKRIATANKGVIDAFNNIIQDKKILVTYVPGNHDLTITAANVESILPGINQVRDNVLGLGTYSPADYPTIAIEHGHRYNFFCAPDYASNQDIAPGTILPPGYFYTRIAALWVSQGFPPASNTVPEITPNSKGGESQEALYKYWKSWKNTLNLYTIQNSFTDKIIVTNLNGMNGNFAVNDLLPYQASPGEQINVNLYNGIQDSWETRQTTNNVPVHIPVIRAIDSVGSDGETDHQASLQYFMNPDSNKKIVIFGHTHVYRIIPMQNYKGEKCVYANSGTWIDHNPGRVSRTFVVVTPQSGDASSQTYVKLYNFENEVVTEMAKDSLRY
ncbi:MAG: hypothetical protein A2X11_05905 [Bacteroidetes bacterium GWE2_42_24]|nr:MAG: hypothetical protein A2X11_05905 [Bacteroidetes bacterium GWE2_42_24]OFY28334.1 MAG: hypothetical protein A2X09_14615 [Bacteroidetes bacterium GWF2_43_11]